MVVVDGALAFVVGRYLEHTGDLEGHCEQVDRGYEVLSMVTQFNIGDEVYLRGKIEEIAINGNGTLYSVKVDLEKDQYMKHSNCAAYEDELISADVEDFRRENPNETGKH